MCWNQKKSAEPGGRLKGPGITCPHSMQTVIAPLQALTVCDHRPCWCSACGSRSYELDEMW